MKKILYTFLLISPLLIIYSCEKEEGINIQIGSHYQGGIIFWMDEETGKGLIASCEKLPSTYEWGCEGDIVPTEDSIGAGLQNTLNIVNHCTTAAQSAAQAALDAEMGGYIDWYLPSIMELEQMHFVLGVSGFDAPGWPGLYWSSSENSQNTTGNLAWGMWESGSLSNNIYKNSLCRVRPIRSF